MISRERSELKQFGDEVRASKTCEKARNGTLMRDGLLRPA